MNINATVGNIPDVLVKHWGWMIGLMKCSSGEKLLDRLALLLEL